MNHECDLFLFTSHHGYYADRALTEFAFLGRRNVDGWGIGSYNGGRANVLKSAETALDKHTDDLSREFSIAIKAVTSPLILGHLRLTSSGASIMANNHPFMLHFLNYDWLMIHNGTSSISDLVPYDRHLLIDSNNDTARVIEYLREQIVNYCTDPNHSLIEGCRKAYSSLLERDPQGSYNIILSNFHFKINE